MNNDYKQHKMIRILTRNLIIYIHQSVSTNCIKAEVIYLFKVY